MNLQILILVMAIGIALAWRLCEFVSAVLARLPNARTASVTATVSSRQRR